MTELFFHTPWWLPALIAGVGIVVFVTGNRRSESRVRLAGAGIIALAFAIAVVSYLVDTPLEMAERRTNELVKAFEKADYPGMTSILDPDSTVSVLNAEVYSNRDEIIKGARLAHEQYGFRSANVVTSSAIQADTVITVSIFLLTEQDALGRTLNSRWEFEWQNHADGWALANIRAIEIGQSTGDQVRTMFPGK